MELLLRQGEYVPDGKGGFRRAEGRSELLQRVLWKLTARRGGFPLLPELGSQLYALTRAKPSSWQALARQYVVQALAEERDLTVREVTLHQEGDVLEAVVSLDWNGESLDVRVEIEE